MAVKELKCPKCGASVSPDRNICDYCRTQYIVVSEPKAILLGEHTECNTFKKLESVKKKVERQAKEGKIDDLFYGDEETHEAERMSKACRVCHIKNCEFFNIDFHELLNSITARWLRRT